MNRAWFDQLADAIEHGYRNGGWIAVCDDGTIQWFGLRWTITPIMLAISGGCEIRPWADWKGEVT